MESLTFGSLKWAVLVVVDFEAWVLRLRLMSTVTPTLISSANVAGALMSSAFLRRARKVHIYVLHFVLSELTFGGQGIESVIEINDRLVIFLAEGPEIQVWILPLA